MHSVLLAAIRNGKLMLYQIATFPVLSASVDPPPLTKRAYIILARSLKTNNQVNLTSCSPNQFVNIKHEICKIEFPLAFVFRQN